VDEDDIPAVYCTIFSPAAGGGTHDPIFAKHYLLDYAHGQYPFVIYRTEVLHRAIYESRGVPEIGATWQQEMKSQHDSVVDYASFNTLPSILVPKTRGQQYRFGPAVQVPVMRPGDVQFMSPPNREPQVAFELMKAVRLQTAEYFGLFDPELDPTRAQLRQQRLAGAWLQMWSEVFRQMFTLSLQYLPAEEIERVTGAQVPPDSVRYDFTLQFDIREMQQDFVQAKLQAISQFILPEDVAGVVDRGKLVEAKLRALDPSLADDLIIPQQQASQQMFNQVKADVGGMLLGMEASYTENDPAAQIKMQYLQQLIESNPKAQAAMAEGGDQIFQDLLKKYAQNLQFSLQQQQNAQIGRIGVQPGA
jgi:hypothetical protein